MDTKRSLSDIEVMIEKLYLLLEKTDAELKKLTPKKKKKGGLNNV